MQDSERSLMERLTAHLRTKSAKIRALAAAGYKRQQIADFLGIRYQHVRNVLVQAPSYRDARQASESGSSIADPAGAYTSSHDAAELPRNGSIVVDAHGRITLPPELAVFEDGELRIMGADAGLLWARQIVRPYLDRISLDDFLEERRREAADEDAADAPDG